MGGTGGCDGWDRWVWKVVHCQCISTLLLCVVCFVPTSISHEYLSLSLPVTFTVMSYNVLCDKYATRQQYGYCPTWALVWDYRKQAILKEILDSTADIVALQVSICLRLI